MLQRCDILIVGGGPAGSTLASQLVAHGMDVIVLDKQTFPRDKTCAGWITPAVIKSVGLNVEAYAQFRVLQPIHGFRISCMGGREVVNSYSGAPVSYGIRRCEFDHYLLQRSGALLRLGEAFRTMQRKGSEWIVNGHIGTPLVVGAGGHFCPVARAMGARLGRTETVVAAQELEFEMSPSQIAQCGICGDTPELFFCDDLKGYGWVFRKQRFLNIGLGREDNHRLSDHVKTFCHFLRRRGGLPQGIPTSFQGHAYLLYEHAYRKIADNSVLLVGDAAGLAYTQSGEGIRPAVESALLAAEVIWDSQCDYRRERLSGYIDRLTQRFGKREGNPAIIDLLPAELKRSIARRLLATHWFTRYVLTDRWFLHVHQAAPPGESS
jgi:geranylgeranyl reductase family protein